MIATQPDPPRPERLAAIDVGSNSIRLLVADWDPRSGLSVVDEVKAQPRLAQGLATTGRIDPDAIVRALDALERMNAVAQRRGVSRLAAVATAAVREAENGEQFIQLVQRRFGIPLTIIDPETEARLSYRSVAHHFRLDRQRTVIVDIGGGSLEVIGAARGVIDLTLSLPFGAVRLTERYLDGRRNPRKALGRLRARIRKQLRRAAQWPSWRGAQVVGSGGTFTNLGRMAAGRRGLDMGAVHGTHVTTAELEHLLERLTTMKPAARAQVPGLNPQRADIILAGLAVTAEVLDQLDSPELVVSAYGLREGLLLEMIGVHQEPAADPLRLAREFAERCQCDMSHVEQVRRLALQLFDRLGDPLGAEPGERPLLEAAALLHDVGQLISYRKRHRHSYQLIMHADRLGLSARERPLVALVARYHRKGIPGRRHTEFTLLSDPEQKMVRRLAAILRIADGLDRGYTSVVDKLRIRITQGRIRIGLVRRSRRADLSLECWGAQRRVALLERLLGRPVVIAPAK